MYKVITISLRMDFSSPNGKSYPLAKVIYTPEGKVQSTIGPSSLIPEPRSPWVTALLSNLPLLLHEHMQFALDQGGDFVLNLQRSMGGGIHVSHVEETVTSEDALSSALTYP